MSVQKTYIDHHGKLVLPYRLRNQLHLKPGDEVSIECQDDKIVVKTAYMALEKARRAVRKYVGDDESLLDELKIMRAEDASKE